MCVHELQCAYLRPVFQNFKMENSLGLPKRVEEYIDYLEDVFPSLPINKESGITSMKKLREYVREKIKESFQATNDEGVRKERNENMKKAKERWGKNLNGLDAQFKTQKTKQTEDGNHIHTWIKWSELKQNNDEKYKEISRECNLFRNFKSDMIKAAGAKKASFLPPSQPPAMKAKNGSGGYRCNRYYSGYSVFRR